MSPPDFQSEWLPQEVFTVAVQAEFVLGVVTALALLFISAPYGRHGRPGWGPVIPSRLAWILMELPACLWFGYVYFQGEHRAELVPLLLLGLWQVHYVYRTFIFPFVLRVSGRTMPLSLVAVAVLFNVLNGFINARWISHLGSYELSWLADPRFLVGLALFCAGMTINHRADATLRSLRKPGETGYKIPQGRLYRWVSCPNYLGELIEWCGWAVMTWSTAGLAFAFYTAANLVPRAMAHHRWYRSTFDDYPPERRAVIPFVL